jgi:hypothetical protein
MPTFDALAGETGEDAWSGRAAVRAGLDPVADRLVGGVDQPGAGAGVEVDPADVAPSDHADHGADQSARCTDNSAAGLDDGARAVVAEGVGELVLDDRCVCVERRDMSLMSGG